MTEAEYKEIALLVIKMHTDAGECMFSPTAVADIVAAGMSVNHRSKKEIIDALVTAVEEAEIYCPHEGIDRRAEYGLG